jgi:hypothetical protein
MPYENPQRRRLNCYALYAPTGPDPALDWACARRHLTAAGLVDFLLQRQAARPAEVRHLPLVVVLDNASHHHSAVIHDALPTLWAQRIYFYFLPPYSPELNDVERLFRTIKHHDLPERTYPTFDALEAAVQRAFTAHEAALLAQSAHCLGEAA